MCPPCLSWPPVSDMPVPVVALHRDRSRPWAVYRNSTLRQAWFSSRYPRRIWFSFVIPANAGIQGLWFLFFGRRSGQMNEEMERRNLPFSSVLDSGMRRNDGSGKFRVRRTFQQPLLGRVRPPIPLVRRVFSSTPPFSGSIACISLKRRGKGGFCDSSDRVRFFVKWVFPYGKISLICARYDG